MSNIYVLEKFRKIRRGRSKKPIFFDRFELGQLLSVYSRQVAQGHWKDYAIDQLPGVVIFSIFRNTHEHPIFTIAKQIPPNGKGREFIVHQGPKQLSKSDQLSHALKVFDRESLYA